MALNDNVPRSPSSLEDLIIPDRFVTAPSDQPILLRDSGYSTAKTLSFMLVV